MRMWNVDPSFLCNKHLIGEHVEMHMLEGTIRLGRSIEGFIAKGLVETGQIKTRHDALADEMIRRGIKHVSPAKRVDVENRGRVDTQANVLELKRRCEACRRRIEGIQNGALSSNR